MKVIVPAGPATVSEIAYAIRTIITGVTSVVVKT